MGLEPAVACGCGWRCERRARIVEIVGPPGVGKTSLLSSLARRGAGIRPIYRWRRPGSYPTIARDAVELFPLFIAQWRARRALARRDMERMIRLKASRRIADSWRDEVVVMDQGPIYTLATLRLSGCGPEEGGALGSWWRETAQEWAGLLDMVVYLEAEREILLRRIADRGKPHRLKSARGVAGLEWLAMLTNALELTVDSFRAFSGLSVLRFDTSLEDLSGIADRVGVALDGG